MRQHFLMPKLGLTMTEGTIIEWEVKLGQSFAGGETVFVVETDKAANSIEAERAGVLLEIVHDAGAVVAVGETVGYWDDGRADLGSDRVEHDIAIVPVIAQPVTTTGVSEIVPASLELQPAPDVKRLVATPLARKLALGRGIDLGSLRGSGPGGRIKAADLPPSGEAASVPRPPPAHVEPTAMQLTMARRLVAVKQEIPHFYLALEVEVSELVALRGSLNASRPSRITLNDLFVLALGRALRLCPEVDRVWVNDTIVPLGQADVGIAVHAGAALFVPVVRRAGYLTPDQLVQQTAPLIARARKGRLTAAEMSGGAVTISNAGMLDVTYITPIINPGQAMILGVGSIREVFRPDARGQPALCREVGVVLACDHRVLDGVSALRFLRQFKALVQAPQRLLEPD